jgi:anaerobic magnesium-protoporphyrin IX monomethyl ester cyclase
MNILLIRFGDWKDENAVDGIDPYNKREVNKKRGIYPPMGLAQIASVLEEEGYTVSLFDYMVEPFVKEELIQWCKEHKPIFIGMSPWTLSLMNDLGPTAWLKREVPNAKIVIGGPHVTLFPQETLQRFSAVDYIVHGEGELTIRELATVIAESSSPKDVAGIAYRDNGEIYLNPGREILENLDENPFPAFHLLKFDKYSNALQVSPVSTYLVSSRGCPFRCTYCVKPVWDRKVMRYHSPDYFLDQVEEVVNKYGVKEIHFYDDTFTLDRERTMVFSQGVIDRKIDFKWIVRTRTDCVDDEMLALMRKAGCTMISYGVESGNDDVLKIMKRGISVEKTREIFALTKKHGFEIAANIMIGFPGESKETYEDSVRFSKELDPDFVQYSITTAIPGADIYEQTKGDCNSETEDPWRSFALGKMKVVAPEKVRFAGLDYSIHDLDKMLSRAYRSFYFRPKIIWRLLRRLSSFDQLKMYFRLATSVARE